MATKTDKQRIDEFIKWLREYNGERGAWAQGSASALNHGYHYASSTIYRKARKILLPLKPKANEPKK